MVQWLRLCTSTAGGVGLIPGLGRCHMAWPKSLKKKKKDTTEGSRVVVASRRKKIGQIG